MDSQQQHVYHPQPSVPLNTDFDFTFDPSLFPPPPPLPSSADLFTPSETSDLLGFLDAFSFDFENDPSATFLPEQPTGVPAHAQLHGVRSPPPYTNPHLNTAPDPSTAARNPFARALPAVDSNADSPVGVSRTGRTSTARTSAGRPGILLPTAAGTAAATPASTTTTSSSVSAPAPAAQTQSSAEDAGLKPLLSTPQKRLNHIMSEQKRRNAIRDGYAQLISLIAPVGSAHTIAMPSRGRPKGSGGRGKNRTQGKSGVLFRAVEYVRFLEEGREALLEEVLRLEALAGIKAEP